MAQAKRGKVLQAGRAGERTFDVEREWRSGEQDQQRLAAEDEEE